jgi:hypothetical protein
LVRAGALTSSWVGDLTETTAACRPQQPATPDRHNAPPPNLTDERSTAC